MNCSDNCASTQPILSVDYTDTERYVAVSITAPSLGLGDGLPLWMILKANKTTGELSCALRSSLPDVFIPR